MSGAESSIAIAYPVSAADIEGTRESFAALSFDDPKGYAAGVKAIAKCRGTRSQIEQRRKVLKADSLEYGRRVDAAARELVAIVESIEAPLREKKRAVDDAREREQRAAEEAERAARDAAERAQREAEQTALAAERERLAAEDARLREQREQLQAERRELDARHQGERDRVAAEQARHDELARRAEQARWAAELQPDLVKLELYAKAIRGLPAPSLTDPEALQLLESVMRSLGRAAAAIDAFGVAKAGRSIDRLEREREQ